MWNHYLEERESERLFIRPVLKSDYLAWQEFVMDEVATRFFPADWKLKPEKAKEWIDSQIKRYEDKRYGLQALIEKKSGDLIGLCGLLAQTVDGCPELEIGYHLLALYWGNGYATEAAKEFKKMVFDNDLAESIISIIDRQNIPSQKVALRNGMSRERETMFLGMHVFIYKISREDYMKSEGRPEHTSG